MENIFKKRIDAFAQKALPNSVLVLQGAKRVMRNHDVEYPFYQNSHFYYLTGWDAPDAYLIVQIDSKGCACSQLFVEPNNPEAESWQGKRLSPQEILAMGVFDSAFPNTTFNEKLKQAISDAHHVYYPFVDLNQTVDLINATTRLLAAGRVRKNNPDHIDANILLGIMRLYKSEHEIALMQQAADISSKAHISVMQMAKQGLYEYQLAAQFKHYCEFNGCQHLAYDSIVASGKNACVLHYVTCQDQIHSDDLVLIDAGGAYKGYASDITRTFPVSGKFNGAQSDIYTCVLNTQKAVIDAIKPGVLIHELQALAQKKLFDGLVDLQILKRNDFKQITNYYFHGVSHWLGLDVHDQCPYLDEHKKPIKLAPGMVITVEPGLYFGRQLETIPHDYHNIGIRIEDDVLITDKGSTVLSKACPKELDEIEGIMAI
tara:strand:+ start:4152 stop:5441 length:1290 start_codon:yes stop_codon:yes gene_type:complete